MGVTDIHVYFRLESGELVSSTSCSVLFCATRLSNHSIFLGPNSRPTPEVCKAPPQTGEQLQEHCVSNCVHIMQVAILTERENSRQE